MCQTPGCARRVVPLSQRRHTGDCIVESTWLDTHPEFCCDRCMETDGLTHSTLCVEGFCRPDDRNRSQRFQQEYVSGSHGPFVRLTETRDYGALLLT